jgi:hypothetical protein
MNPTPDATTPAATDVDAIRPLEKRLAVVTSWGFFGSFGMGFVLSGFSGAQWWMGLLGYALLVAGFIAHVVINRTFDTGFSSGEIALGLVLFGVSALSFIGSWLFDPGFGSVNLGIGLAGFAAMAACLLGYLVVRYGLRGSYVMVHSLRGR